ncbi:hypothetical protein [Paenibacillus sp. R14(2021)]|uniref:hypothetical protein n=1 Tax=Paenibacillus sp. R14(2021) TaxID=2859228 RepID=UPI001C612896|nr:hypothetical protein [Paenibacillus sp. R14(2021)]
MKLLQTNKRAARWMRLAAIIIGISVFQIGSIPAIEAEPRFHPDEQAAFIRGGALWDKTNERERQLTEAGITARNPAWSSDGRYIAYTRGEDERGLWLLERQSGKSHLAAPDGGRQFQWSPLHNQLAYSKEEKLFVVGVEEGAEPIEVASAIGSFSWLPDGSGFLVSSAAELLPDGWTPVVISRILLQPGSADPVQSEQLHVLPKQINELIVVGTSRFKWSASGRWIAFLAMPTASLSADSNTLCVLSADGKQLITLDQMAKNEQWFQWSPAGDRLASERLAYIGGIGREAVSNKQLIVTAIPELRKVNYTPAGFVDQSLAWYGNREIIVSRAKAQAWSSNPQLRSRPFLTIVHTGSEGQRRITKPAAGWGDYNPVSLSASSLSWVRSNRESADVMLAAASGGLHAVPWIKKIDLGTNFYEQWNWEPVLQFYVKPQK